MAEHKRLVGPRANVDAVANTHTIIESSLTDRQATLLVRRRGPIFDPAWQVSDASLEDIVLAYLSQNNATAPQAIAAAQGTHQEVRV